MSDHVGDVYVNGRRLVYELHGTGPHTLVFVHGLLADARLNRPLARALGERGHRVVVPDLLGHGRSDRVRDPAQLRLERYAEQVVALLDHLGLEHATIGGVSLGANVALEVAAGHGDRVAGLVVESPVLERGAVAGRVHLAPLLLALRAAPWLARCAAAAVAHWPRTGLPAIDALLDAASTDPDMLAAVIDGWLSGPTAPSRSRRRRIGQPALVIGHVLDPLHPIEDAAALVAELPDARLVVATSVLEAHACPDRLVAHIAAFLDDLTPPVPLAA